MHNSIQRSENFSKARRKGGLVSDDLVIAVQKLKPGQKIFIMQSEEGETKNDIIRILDFLAKQTELPITDELHRDSTLPFPYKVEITLLRPEENYREVFLSRRY